MQIKQKSKYLYLLWILPFLCIGLCVVNGYYFYNRHLAKENAVLEEIGKRTGLPPDWQAIREYVYCDLLQPGTPKPQVDEGLPLIGPYSLPDEGYPIEHIDFKDPPTRYNLSPLIIEYDKEWKVSSSGAGEFNHGPRAKCEIERAASQVPITPVRGGD